jgi:hypothetical protein
MSKDTNTEILKLFKEQLIDFLDELISQFPKEGDFVFLRILVKDRVPIKDIMVHTKTILESCKQMINERDEEFFLRNESIFSVADKDRVNYFKKIWSSNDIDDDIKTCIWSWVDLFLQLSEKYTI